MKILTQSSNRILFIGFLAMLYFVSCKQEIEIKPFYEGIYERRNVSLSGYIAEKGDTFSRFRDVLLAGGLENTLTAHNPHGNDYTLFMPTNDAFDRFIASSGNFESFKDLVADSGFAKAIVKYHVVNTGIESTEFPFGSLPDTTLSGDLLTINYVGDIDSIVPVVNNEGSIITFDIELSNGFIHIIDEVLQPVFFSTYEWLIQQGNYTIMTKALEETGLSDTFKFEIEPEEYQYTSNSMFVESDAVFNAGNIYSFEDLANAYSPESNNYKTYNNGLYQFVAYHILAGKQFLNAFEGVNSNFNTYASNALNVDGRGIDIKINKGASIVDTIETETDTTIIDYVRLIYENSNVTTKNGAVHNLQDIMKVFSPKPRERAFEFYEDPIISEASGNPNSYIFEKRSKFTVIDWTGVESILYVKSGTNISGLFNDDYIEINGDFTFTYHLPKIIPGKYMLQLRANNGYFNNATIQVQIDGRDFGRNYDLSIDRDPAAYYSYDVGQVDFIRYETHTLTIKTLIPGRMRLDAINIVPIPN